MTSENPQELLESTVNGTTTVWDTKTYGGINYSVEWSGMSALDASMELQASMDKINWNCYGGASGEFNLDAASGLQLLEIHPVTFPYWRLSYSHGANASGLIVVRSYGRLLHRAT